MTPLWRLREARDGEWWAVDIATGTAFAVDREVADRLWRSDSLLEAPFSQALTCANSATETPHFVDVAVDGATTRFRFTDSDRRAVFLASFGGTQAEIRCSPDLIVDLNENVDIDSLHRAVDDRTGATVRSVGEDAAEEIGRSDLPLVPPMQADPYRGAYCGLHGAMVKTSNRNLVICGAQKSGKTTTALVAQHLHLGDILTDEACIVDRVGRVCPIPLPIRERTQGGRTSYPLTPTRQGSRALHADGIAILTGCSTPKAATAVHSTRRALALVAPHARSLDGSLGLMTSNLVALLNNSQVFEWPVRRTWPNLRTDIEAHLTGWVKQECAI